MLSPALRIIEGLPGTLLLLPMLATRTCMPPALPLGLGCLTSSNLLESRLTGARAASWDLGVWLAACSSRP